MAGRKSNSRHLVLFDGGCGFCGSVVALIASRDSLGVFRYASLDSDEGERIRATHSPASGVHGSLLVVPSGDPGPAAPLQKSAAALFIVRRLKWPWPLVAGLGFLPKRLLDWAYDQVARHRYMLSGSGDACAVPVAASEKESSN